MPNHECIECSPHASPTPTSTNAPNVLDINAIVYENAQLKLKLKSKAKHNSTQKIECDTCGFTSHYKNAYVKHFESKRHKRCLNENYTSHEYVCHPCKYGTNSSKIFSSHCRTERHAQMQGSTDFQCECKKYFHSARALTFHRKTCKKEILRNIQLIQSETVTPVCQPVPPTPPTLTTIPNPPDIDTLVNENSELKTQLSQTLGKFDEMMQQIGELKRWQAGEERQRCGICFNLQDRTKRLQKHTMDGKEFEICQECCLKTTGYSSTRPEIIVREYLKRYYKQHMLIANKRVKGDACLLYLPDILYGDPNRVIIIEVDEHGHCTRAYECDQRRMSDMYDEFAGKEVIWIRFNPHKYPGGNKDLHERLPELLSLLERIETMDFETKMHVFYMYYDPDWQNVAKDLPKTFVS
jgi:hypothetical protein